MKILLLVGNLSAIGGIQKYNRNLINALQQSGEIVSVVELKKSALFSKLAFIIRSFWSALIFRPDIIFCGHINFSPLALFLDNFLNRNYIIFTYGVDASRIENKLQITALKKAKFIITISRYTAEVLKTQVPELKDRIFLLPPAVDEKEFFSKEKPRDLLSKLKLSPDHKIILTVARLSASEKYKGYDKVIHALPLVLREIPETKYIIVGTGDDEARIKGIIKELKLEKHVVLAGQVPNLLDYYNLCDTFAMPSKGEGFGIVFLEALACGKPVVAGNKDGSRDALLDGELGILIEPDSAHDIAAAIVDVLNKKINPKLLDGQYLRKRVIEEYGLPRFKEKVGQLLDVLRNG